LTNLGAEKMKSAIIFHSYSGITRGVAEKLSQILGSEMIEIMPEQDYSRLMVYPKGCYRAMKGLCDPVRPERIDVSDFDVVMIASPVWAGKPTPAINGAIEGLIGCTEKPAAVIVTCRSAESGTEALAPLVTRLKAKGLNVQKTAVFDKYRSRDDTAIRQLAADIKVMMGEV